MTRHMSHMTTHDNFVYAFGSGVGTQGNVSVDDGSAYRITWFDGKAIKMFSEGNIGSRWLFVTGMKLCGTYGNRIG